jgi:uncharacterized protein YndB with AHSA1/START domain
MRTTDNATIIVRTIIDAPIKKVWKIWIDPEHIVHWNNASDDWHTRDAENDLREGGRFRSRMEARDGSQGFDFSGEYTRIVQYRHIEYTLDDGRRVQVTFIPNGDETIVSETFESETENSPELQQKGWQSILDNFKKYVENFGKSEVMHYEIKINAPVEKVYKTMIDKKNYSEWTSVFNPTSHFVGSWEKGSKILFIGADEDGSEGGMVSRIRENIPNRFISIEHLGIIEKGREVMTGIKVDQWAGALENYTFIEDDGKTVLKIDVDVVQEWKSYFDETWPKALNKLRLICEEV